MQLRPLSSVAQRKLQRRQQALTSAEMLAERAGLAGRAVAVSRGNPGLQDLIGLKLVYGDQVGLDRAEAAVTGMEEYLRQGDMPAEAEVRGFLENLALDTLLEEAGTADVALLRAVTLFTIPVHEAVIDVLADQVGGSVARLRGLGLLDPYPDLHDPGRLAVVANPLAAGRAAPLSQGEEAALAGVSAGPLLAAWGGATPNPGRGLALDLQLARLGLLADDPAVTAASAPGAVAALRSGPAAEAFRLGQEAISLLDRHHQPVPLQLLRRTADAALTSGDGHAGEALLDRAAEQAESGEEHGTGPLDRARVITEQGRRLITRGEPDQAGQLFQRAHELFTTAGSELEAAVVMGSIADIAERRGDYDEALRIRREVQLPVYGRLGVARETAVTWGKIADISERRGDYDEALRIRREVQLPVYERLGDTRETALAWGKIADISERRGDYDEALRIYREVQLPVFERLGVAWETAVTWGKIADIAYQRGDYEEALRVRREVELPVYERLGDTRETAVAWGKIADIAERRGDYNEALRIHREVQLPVFERLGDTRETALAWGRIADIAERRGDYDEALRIHREVQLPVYERLGDTRETAVTWGKIADIAERRGDYDEALRIYREVALPVFERLGDTRFAAVAWGKIAGIAERRGDYDEALRIHREVELPVYERLGDTRETAVAWGKIADIAQRRGDYDEAAELHRKRLEACKQLGDLGQIASIDWALAQIDLAREDNEAAFPRLVESFQILGRLQRPDGIAVVGAALGRLLLAAGQADQGRQVLGDSLAAATKIGWTGMVEHISELLNPPDTTNEDT